MIRKKQYVSWVLFYCLIISLFLLGTWFGNAAIQTISQEEIHNNRHCIIIDAGHGGVDGGATSVTGVLESEINLQFALRLNDLFNLLGYDTTMIRTADISVYTDGDTIAAKKVSDLKNRVKIVNGTVNPILISLHQNYFSDGKYHGAQVFYAPNESSSTLAKEIQNQLVSTINQGSKRVAKQADNIYLMNHIQATGVLIECGFLSNAEEEYRLRDGNYQKQFCCVVAATVSQYLDR